MGILTSGPGVFMKQININVVLGYLPIQQQTWFVLYKYKNRVAVLFREFFFTSHSFKEACILQLMKQNAGKLEL